MASVKTPDLQTSTIKFMIVAVCAVIENYYRHTHQTATCTQTSTQAGHTKLMNCVFLCELRHQTGRQHSVPQQDQPTPFVLHPTSAVLQTRVPVDTHRNHRQHRRCNAITGCTCLVERYCKLCSLSRPQLRLPCYCHTWLPIHARKSRR